MKDIIKSLFSLLAILFLASAIFFINTNQALSFMFFQNGVTCFGVFSIILALKDKD
jgi:uncharacterized membrane protein HdeD (DUF308 family)